MPMTPTRRPFSRLLTLAMPLTAAVILPHRVLGGPLTTQAPPQVERDVAYVEGGGTDQRLDLYLPRTERFPTVIFIHGGSLSESGERRSSELYARVCEPFVASGIGCATMDYRLAPTHKWPAMPNDVAAAVKWVKTNIASRGGDPARIVLFGHSSGCQLAAAVGTNPEFLAGVGLDSSALAGVVAMGCTLAPLDQPLRQAKDAGLSMAEVASRWAERSDDRDTYRSFDDRLGSDPSRHIGPHVPPTLIVIAARERFLPPLLEQGAHFVRLMYEHLRPADIAIVPGTHKTSIADIVRPGDLTFAAIQAFIEHPTAAGEGSRPSNIIPR